MATTGSQLENFEAFLTQGTIQVDPLAIVTALLLSGLLSFILAKLYIKYGESLSNRKVFAKNFVLLTVTTTLIIFIVKSSLALSLGLVGALSIVRFRAAIKEPEELIFLFIAISVGLGMGAGQIKVTVISFIIISIFIILRHINREKSDEHEMHLIVSGNKLSLEKVTNIVKKHSVSAKLRRFDETDDKHLEASYSAEVKSFKDLENLKAQLQETYPAINITYLDKVEI
jgi:hypothetical protein